MIKMADACQRAGGQQTRFHEMHVQRHNNVSILYADIVNFTPLSEQLTASDLVKTLNELFGRFDQIAQVNQLHTTKLFVIVKIICFSCRRINVYVLKFLAIVIIVCRGCQSQDHNMRKIV